MGTMIGHVGPGFGFFMIGLWHMYNHLRLLARNGPSSYRSYPWFPSTLLRRLELYLIIAGTTLSVAMELFIGPEKHQPLDSDGTIPSNHLHNFEHSSISLTFLVYASFALALDKYSALKPIPAQHDVVQFVGALAFAQEFILFHLHSADHMGVEGQYHWLLQLVVFVSLATTVLGFGRGRERFVVALARSVSIMFQGVWFMVMGFALWTPGLIAKGCFMNLEEGHKVVRCDGEASLHRAKALVNIQFSWLLILVAAFTASFYVIMMLVYHNGKSSVEYNPMSSSSSSSLTLSNDEAEEDDVEAQRIDTKFTETQRFVNNNKVVDHMER